MSFIWMLLIGLLIGVVAKFLMPGKDPGGLFITALIGVAGALLAGYLGRGMGMYADGEPAGFIASVIGAILLLAGYRMIARKRA